MRSTKGDGASSMTFWFLEHRNSGRGHHLLGFDLGAHGAYRVDWRPDPHQPRSLHGRGEIGVLRKESVAGVYGVGAGRAGRRDDRLGVQIIVRLR
jgi:hypothetical protein